MKDNNIKIMGRPSQEEVLNKAKFRELFRRCPLPENEVMANLGVFMGRNLLSRILYMHELYNLILDVPGMVLEFGVRWGQDLALFESFRGLYEPYNYNRRIIGFDTFEGFVSVDEKDGGFSEGGDYSSTPGYERYLEEVMDCHERDNPISHIKKYDIVKGDASVEVPKYLSENPETMIALAYFDMDVYKPTRDCIEAIEGHFTKGSVIAFDELNFCFFPGETLALKEAWGLDRYKIVRSRYSALGGYIVVG